jgi:hypothetical protein
MKVEPIPEDGSPFKMPGFLEKSNSMTSTGSGSESPLTAPSRPNGSALPISGLARRCNDEGLGESLDQQSDPVDSSPKEQRQGYKDCATVEEERESVHSNDQRNNELTLDPSKLEEGMQDPASDAPVDSSPFNQKVGSIKKVSFYSGEEAEDTDGTEGPVSDTYVYEGKPKWRLGFKKK